MSIATFIKDDLAVAIRSGQMPEDGLTIDRLSRRYRVSPSPIRSAVQQLINEGYLRKGENRRLSIEGALLKGALAMKPEPPKDWCQIISDDLVRLSLDGIPISLREESTAERYGISRSAIRQIFYQLAGRGLVKHLPRRGWQLRPFRQEDLAAYTDMREMLEVKALELAWPRLVDEDLQAKLDGNQLPATMSDEPICDNTLHRYWIDKAKHPYISDFFDRHGEYYRILYDWEAFDRKRRLTAVQQHREILEAILRRDQPAAVRALVVHIREGHPQLQNRRKDPDDQDSRITPLPKDGQIVSESDVNLS